MSQLGQVFPLNWRAKAVAPTTVQIDRGGLVRWVSRRENDLERPTPDEVLAALARFMSLIHMWTN